MADEPAAPEQDVLGDLDFPSDVYFDFDFDFDDIGALDIFPDAPSGVDTLPAIPGASVEPMPFHMVNEVERWLMMEEGGEGEDQQAAADDFFADVFFVVSDEGSVGSGLSSGDTSTPEENAVEGTVAEEDKVGGESDPERKVAASEGENEKEANGEDSERKSEEDEDLGKKRRRQMRNRDSAMKSRERKKMYVRDLEIKSKFLESECRRLQHALHCCVTENVALRQCLQKAKAFGAPAAKQESAVLFVESLLLGSLFWLMSIMCLVLMPPCPLEVIENASGVARGRTETIATNALGSSEKGGPVPGSEFIYQKRRCKSLRRKMRINLFPLKMIFG